MRLTLLPPLFVYFNILTKMCFSFRLLSMCKDELVYKNVWGETSSEILLYLWWKKFKHKIWFVISTVCPVKVHISHMGMTKEWKCFLDFSNADTIKKHNISDIRIITTQVSKWIGRTLAFKLLFLSWCITALWSSDQERLHSTLVCSLIMSRGAETTHADTLTSPLLHSCVPNSVTQLQCLHCLYCEHKYQNQFTSIPTGSGISWILWYI